MRMPQLRLFRNTRLRHAVHRLRHVFEVCEKSFSSSRLSFESASMQASHTRLALFLRSVQWSANSRTMPPWRPSSPQPASGQWKLSEKSQFSTVHRLPWSTRRPMSQPLALRFLSVTPETPLAETATPLKFFGSPAVAPTSHAPRPSTVMFDALMTIGP